MRDEPSTLKSRTFLQETRPMFDETCPRGALASFKDPRDALRKYSKMSIWNSLFWMFFECRTPILKQRATKVAFADFFLFRHPKFKWLHTSMLISDIFKHYLCDETVFHLEDWSMVAAPMWSGWPLEQKLLTFFFLNSKFFRANEPTWSGLVTKEAGYSHMLRFMGSTQLPRWESWVTNCDLNESLGTLLNDSVLYSFVKRNH